VTRDIDNTQIVVADSRTTCLLVFPVPGENAGDALRHPFWGDRLAGQQQSDTSDQAGTR
jgi:hypothetical protein